MAKRANGEGTIYKRPNGSWCAQVTVTSPDGRRRRKTVYGKDRQTVIRKRKALLQQVESGYAISTSRPPTLADYGDHWLGETLRARVVLGLLAQSTWNSYRDQWKKHIEPSLGRHRLDALTPDVLRNWQVVKSTEKSARGKPFAARTVKYLHAILNKALSDAVRDGYITTNPMKRVDAPAVPKKAIEPFDASELAVVLHRDLNDSLRPLWLLLLGTGLRIGEAVVLTWADVDLAGKVVSVSKTYGYLPGAMSLDTPGQRPRGAKSTKTPASTAPVPLPDVVVEALKEQRRSVAKRRLAAPTWNNLDLVFPSEVGTHLEPANLLKRWKTLWEDAGFDRNVTLHQLRHTTATWMHQQGVDGTTIKTILRHTREETTANIYTHVQDASRQGAAAKMSDLLQALEPDRPEKSAQS